GHMRRDMFFTMYQLRHAKRHIEAVQTANKSIATRKMQGVVNSDRNPVRSDNKQLLLDGDLLYINDDRGKRRINLGNMNGVFVFEIFDKTGKKRTIYMNEDGDMTITGVFSTGTEDEARTVIDKNGIQSYDANGNRYGLWCNEPSSSNQRYTDFNLYYNGRSIFQIYNGIDETSVRLQGETIIQGGNGITKGTGKWKFEQGASGKFTTADGKRVTVSGGLITDITDMS
ncbi:MAG: hypothetical protein HFE52_07840, partial [Clostridia bacterium]|nr:hypothetical protein [Clostridia bacterium]